MIPSRTSDLSSIKSCHNRRELSARTGWFDTAVLGRLADAHVAGRADNSRLLWQLLMLDKSLVRLGIIA